MSDRENGCGQRILIQQDRAKIVGVATKDLTGAGAGTGGMSKIT